jgi:signal transduction histidine kinase
LFLLCTLIGLFSFSTFLAQYRLESDDESVGKTLLDELSAAWTVFLLLPLLLGFLARLPIRRDNWFWSLPAHLLASVCFGASHTTLMTISRTWLYPIFGFGRYEPGKLIHRYPMEYHKQLLLYIAVAAVVYALGRLRAARAREREAAELSLRTSRLQNQLSEARLQALQGRLQPHFLFNTLNMISSLMYEDVQKADRMIARLSTLLRASLDTAERPCIPLRRELQILEVYLEIMEARLGPRLHIAREVDPAMAGVPVPALILQPLVENAIRHGEPEAGRAVEIGLQALRRGDSLRLVVADNGPGLPGGELASQGVGLSSVRDRLTQLYGAAARITLENGTPRGLRVVIELPVAFPEGAEAGRPGVAVAASAVQGVEP